MSRINKLLMAHQAEMKIRNEQSATVLGGMSPVEFLRDYWQKRPLLIRQAFPNLQTDIDEHVVAGLACEEGIESRLVTRQGNRWKLAQGPFAESTLSELHLADWTLLVQDVDKYIPAIAEFLDRFAFIPDWRVDDVMISIAAENGGVGPHVDAYDVFLLQTKGKRRWRIAEHFDPEWRDDSELKILKRFKPEQEWILEPGDMLYLPPNVAHDGIALKSKDICMTWSIGFRAPSLQDMISDWVELIQQRISDDTFYTDPDLKLAESEDGRISAAAHHRALHLLRSTLEQPDRAIFEWFGRYVTEPKHWLACEAPPNEIDIQQLKSCRLLQRDPRARLAWSLIDGKAVLFVDGDALHDFDSPELLSLVCCTRKFEKDMLSALVNDSLACDLLLALCNKGVLLPLETDHA